MDADPLARWIARPSVIRNDMYNYIKQKRPTESWPLLFSSIRFAWLQLFWLHCEHAQSVYHNDQRTAFMAHDAQRQRQYEARHKHRNENRQRDQSEYDCD